MSPLKSIFGTHNRRCQLAVATIGGLLCTAAILYCTAKWSPVPASASQSADAVQSSLAPFLDIVPSQDGTALYVKAGGVGELTGQAAVNLGTGQGCHKGSWTMVYSDTTQTYAATVPGLNPSISAYAPLYITTTQGLSTDPVEFYRVPVPASTIQDITSRDGRLQLSLASTDVITFDTYVVVVPSYAPPGPAPHGHQLVSSPYSVRAAGALVTTAKPMGLRLYYDQAALAGADPHTLSIFAWYAHPKEWKELGGTLFATQSYLAVATDYFTTYALMATPSWRDEFYDLSGMDPLGFQNVTWSGGPTHHLYLAGTPGSGSALSLQIAPPAAFAHWDTLTFAYSADPPTTTLTVDLLDAKGSVVLADVESGADLLGLDEEQYPALVLRVNMTSTVAGETPVLDAWRLSWQIHTVYVPVIVSEETGK